MERIGLRGGHVRLPLLPVSSGDAALLDELLKPVALAARD
jgi:hypothetical protein